MLFYPKQNINFQLHALHRMTSAKKVAKFFLPPPPSCDLNTLVLHGASLFFVASLASGLDNVESLMWCLQMLGSSDVGTKCDVMKETKKNAQICNWFVEKLVGLNQPKLLLVGACLSYGLQSQSPTDPHLYACAGMDYDPRVQGTPGPVAPK